MQRRIGVITSHLIHSRKPLAANNILKMYSTTASSTQSIYSRLEAEVIEPKSGAPPKSTIIWMHGLGDSSEGFKYLFRQISAYIPNTRIVLPNAPMRPITCNGGYVMRGWYDIKSIDRLEAELDLSGLDKSCALLHELFNHEFQTSKSVICGGFSQGAATSLAGVFTYKDHPISALICCSGYSMYGKRLLEEPKYQNVQDSVPIYLFHGEMDPVVPYNYAMNTYKELVEKKKDKIQMFVDPDQGHELTDDQVRQLITIFREHCTTDKV